MYDDLWTPEQNLVKCGWSNFDRFRGPWYEKDWPPLADDDLRLVKCRTYWSGYRVDLRLKCEGSFSQHLRWVYSIYPTRTEDFDILFEWYVFPLLAIKLCIWYAGRYWSSALCTRSRHTPAERRVSVGSKVFWQVRCIPDVPVSASKHREPHIVSGTKSNWEAQGSDRCIGERGWVNERSK